MAPKRPKINLLRLRSVQELEEWQACLRSQGGTYTGEDLSGPGLLKKMVEEQNFVVVAHDVPCPMECEVPPGSIVITEHEGMPARWLNGTLLVRKDHLDRNNTDQSQ